MYAPSKRWADYYKRFDFVRDIYSLKKDVIFKDDMYHNYLRAVDICLNHKVDEDNPHIPKYMKSDDYEYIKINTALGAFAQLKHANVLYSKQVMAEMGAPEEEETLHYIEPNVALYEHMAKTLEDAYDMLSRVDKDAKSRYWYMTRFIEDMRTFADISKKEIAGEDVSKDELKRLAHFGGFCDSLRSNFDSNQLEWQYGVKLGSTRLSEPVISDIARSGDMFLELAVGFPMEMYVVVKQNGKNVLAKGVVYSAYEFYYPDRLKDEEWHEVLAEQGEDGYYFTKLNPEMSILKFMPYAKHFVNDEENKIKRKYEEVDF